MKARHAYLCASQIVSLRTNFILKIVKGGLLLLASFPLEVDDSFWKLNAALVPKKFGTLGKPKIKQNVIIC